MAVLQIIKKDSSGIPNAAKSSTDAKEPDTQVVEQDTPSTDEATSDSDKDVTIVMQGPMSHVYTKALRAMYAFEEYDVRGDGTDITSLPLREEVNNEGVVTVYAIPDSSLSGRSEGVAESGNRLKLALDEVCGNGKGILAVECAGVIDEHKSRVLGYLGALGVKIVYSPRQLKKELQGSF